jgi:phosphotransferase system enzyme I (PtsP)
MAANPLEAIALAGLGFRTFSMPTSAFGEVKRSLRSLDCAAIEAYLASRLLSADRTLREDIHHFAQDRGYFH